MGKEDKNKKKGRRPHGARVSCLAPALTVDQSTTSLRPGADITHVIDCVCLRSAPLLRLNVEPGASISRHLSTALNAASVINVSHVCCLVSTYYANFRVDDQNSDATARNLLSLALRLPLRSAAPSGS